jgi:hypothetical protein
MVQHMLDLSRPRLGAEKRRKTTSQNAQVAIGPFEPVRRVATQETLTNI